MGFFKKHLTSLILLALGITAFIRGIIFLDPDFGWHLRMGGLILQKGIPLTDPFSYTMSSYPFVDHEWLSNILISIGYKSIGIYGLALIFALIFISALFLAIPKQFKNYSTLPLVLAGAAILGFTGIRTQVITWFFLALLLKIIFDENLWKKYKLFIPLIFILWVDLHGGFAVGIVILFLVFIFKSWQNRKFEFGYFGVVLLSVVLTFVNPYGPRIWWEIWQQISDGNLKWHIAEWSPGFFDTDVALLALFALSFSFLLRYKAKIGKIPVIIYLFLLLMAVSALRQIPLWALSAVFVVSAAIRLLMIEVENNKFALERLKKATKILTIIIFAVFVLEIVTSILGVFDLSEQRYYPAKAVVYLNRQNFAGGNIFTLYDYGGYLIWKLPNKKVFIDGRMPSWRRDGIFPNESNYAFKDYLKMLGNETYFMQIVKKYNIHYVLLPDPELNNKKLSPLAVKLENITEKFVLWRTNTTVINEDLTSFGFKKIYNDGHFVIYKI